VKPKKEPFARAVEALNKAKSFLDIAAIYSQHNILRDQATILRIIDSFTDPFRARYPPEPAPMIATSLARLHLFGIEEAIFQEELSGEPNGFSSLTAAELHGIVLQPGPSDHAARDLHEARELFARKAARASMVSAALSAVGGAARIMRRRRINLDRWALPDWEGVFADQEITRLPDQTRARLERTAAIQLGGTWREDLSPEVLERTRSLIRRAVSKAKPEDPCRFRKLRPFDSPHSWWSAPPAGLLISG
jgi:hypothetical protein